MTLQEAELVFWAPGFSLFSHKFDSSLSRKLVLHGVWSAKAARTELVWGAVSVVTGG